MPGFNMLGSAGCTQSPHLLIILKNKTTDEKSQTFICVNQGQKGIMILPGSKAVILVVLEFSSSEKLTRPVLHGVPPGRLALGAEVDPQAPLQDLEPHDVAGAVAEVQRGRVQHVLLRAHAGQTFPVAPPNPHSGEWFPSFVERTFTRSCRSSWDVLLGWTVAVLQRAGWEDGQKQVAGRWLMCSTRSVTAHGVSR